MSSGKEIKYPEDRKYSQTHEWVKMDGDVAVVGISDYAQDSLGDIVFVELPVVGMKLNKGETFGVVESVKAASDLYSPISGEVQSINQELVDTPDIVNRDALGDGWMIKISPANVAEVDQLFDSTTYRSKIESGELH